MIREILEGVDLSVIKCIPLGNCVTLANGFFDDATEMAQVVDKGVAVDISAALEVIDDTGLKKEVLKNKSNFEAYVYKGILWIYDLEEDIHHFFQFRNEQQLSNFMGLLA